MINIVGGKNKKTKLSVPMNIVRPTSVQKREAIFSIIESYGLKICKKNNFEIKQENILNSNFADINKKISVVFIDPPYKIKPFKKIFKKIIQSKILSKNAIIIVEYSKDSNIEIPSFFSCYAERQYRNTKISFLIIKK